MYLHIIRRVARRVLPIPAALMPLLAGAAPAQIPSALLPPASPDDPVERLSRYLRILSANPRDLGALTGAGRAALDVGDPSAAVGFFARAQEAAPRDGRAKAGLAAALVQLEQPRDALRLFEQAKDLGVPEAEFAADRGLAYDLRGDNRRAQDDYRRALATHADDAETTRRLALSLAMSGDRQQALAVLDPLLRRQDRAAWRASTFVLAMTGDSAGADARVGQLMVPAQAQAMRPFLDRLAALHPAEQAAAVHFGHFPSTTRAMASTRLATAAPRRPTAADRALVPQGAPFGAAPIAATSAPLPTATAPRSASPGFTDMFADARAAGARAARRRPGEADAVTPAPPAQRSSYATGRLATSGDALPRAAAAVPVTAAAATPARPSLPPAAPIATARAAPAVVAIAPASAPVTPAPVTTPVPVDMRPVAVASAPVATPPVAEPAPAPARAQPAATIYGPPAPAAAPLASVPPTETASAPSSATPAASAPEVRTPAATQPRVAPSRTAEAAPPAVRAATPRTRSVASADERAPATPPARRGAKGRAGSTAGTTDDVEQAMPVVPPRRGAGTRLALADTDPPTATRHGRKGQPAADDADANPGGAPRLTPKQAKAQAAADAKAAKAAAAAKEAKAKAAKDAEAKRLARQAPERYWVQVAGGANKKDLPKAWAQAKAQHPQELAGRAPHTTPLRFTNRLLVGPFKSADEAQAFVNRTAKGGWTTFTFTSPAGQQVESVAAK